MTFCPNCGKPVPEGARFCPGCAHSLPELVSVEERKLATVLFADLVGSTQLADSQDPERTRAVMNRFYDAMAAEIAEVGGTVEKFVGDAVMAAFGAPAAQEDHAERALHAALAMQRRLKELFGDALALRIGVNTGEVIVGLPREGSSFVTGDAVNVAARLEQAAQAGEILVGDRTAAAVSAAFEFLDPTTVEAKGKSGGVNCRKLVRALSLMRPRGIGGLGQAFVGRERDLAALQTAYGRAVEELRPRLVTIVGDVGVGKTTLVRQFWAWLGTQTPEPLRRVGRCVSYGQAVTYVAVGEILREHLGLRETDEAEAVLERLGDHAILGLTLGLEASSDLHPLAARDQLRQAWVAFLQRLVTAQPVVVLLEDLHWAEEALLDLLEAALEDVDGPLLLLGTTRPDLDLSGRSFGGRGRQDETLWIERLSPADTAQLLDELTASALPAASLDLVIERTDGNPFFVEELVLTLIDQGVLVRDGDGWRSGKSSDAFLVPDTVQAVIAARIDLLEPVEKAALQAAAVIGRTFWAGPLYELLDGAQPNLRLLEDRDFIRHRPASSIEAEREFAINHALTREIAYRSLPKARRAVLHARFAAWLERVGEGRPEHARSLAHHYAEAVKPEDTDLVWTGKDEELAALRARAIRWLRSAAELAIGRYEMEDALALLDRAVELEAHPSERMQIWREVARASALFFDGLSFANAMQQAIDLAEDASERAELHAELAFQTLVRAGMWGTAPPGELVDGWIERALELAEPESASRAKALIARCYASYEKSEELATEATAIAEVLDDPAMRSYGYDVLSLRAFVAHDYAQALEWQQRRLSLAGVIRDPDHQADIYGNAIAPAAARGRWDKARDYSAAHDQVTRRLSPHHRLHGISALLELDELRGDWDAVAALQPDVEASVGANTLTPCVRNQRSLLVCALSRAYLGDDEEAARLEQEAEAHSMIGYGTVLATPRIQLALHRGDLGAVASLIGEPGVRRTNWFYLSSMATQLDALAALGERTRVETAADHVLRPGTYLEPFALRALGLVRKDASLLELAAGGFETLQLDWHAARTRTLV